MPGFRGESRMGTEGGRGALNIEDLGLELEINGDLRLSNSDLRQTSGSRGGLQLAPFSGFQSFY